MKIRNPFSPARATLGLASQAPAQARDSLCSQASPPASLRRRAHNASEVIASRVTNIGERLAELAQHGAAQPHGVHGVPDTRPSASLPNRIAGVHVAPAAPFKSAGAAGHTPPPKTRELSCGRGNARLSINQAADGTWITQTAAKPPRNMVLCGAGAKGVAYPGAVRAMEESGQMKEVHNVFGSSAGALMGAMVAAGGKSERLAAVTNEQDFTQMLSRKDGSSAAEAKPPAGGLAGKAGLASAILTNLGTTAPRLLKQVNDETRSSVLDVMKHQQPGCEHQKVAAIGERLRSGGNVTFNDLRTLHKAFSDIKEFHCTGTAVIGDRPQLVVYNADSAPDMDIGEAAMRSAALPGVFADRTLEMSHAVPDELKSRVSDGGALLNYPIPEMANAGVHNEDASENMIIMSQSSQIQAALGGEMKAGANVVDHVADALMQMAYSANDKFMHAETAAEHRDQVVIAPMDVGERSYAGNAGLLRFDMSKHDKEALQNALYENTRKHIQDRNPQEQRHATLEQALLALDDKQFSELSKEGDARADPVIADTLRRTGQVRNTARKEVDSLASKVAASGDAGEVRAALQDWAGKLPQDLRHPDAQQLLLRRLTTPVDQAARGAEHKALERAAAVLEASPTLAQGSSVLGRWSRTLEAKDASNIARTIARDLIAPAKTKLGQNAANLALLDSAERELKRATTRDDVNRVLDGLSQGYRLRTPGLLRTVGGPSPARLRETGQRVADMVGGALPGNHPRSGLLQQHAARRCLVDPQDPGGSRPRGRSRLRTGRPAAGLRGAARGLGVLRFPPERSDLSAAAVVAAAAGDRGLAASAVISNSGMSLERSEIGDAKRVDPL